MTDNLYVEKIEAYTGEYLALKKQLDILYSSIDAHFRCLNALKKGRNSKLIAALNESLATLIDTYADKYKKLIYKLKECNEEENQHE